MIARTFGVRIGGIAAVLPSRVISNDQLSQFQPEERAKLIEVTGIQSRRTVNSDVCTSDLCYEAALDLIASTSTQVEDIGVIIFVSQTPDYVLPPTSIVLAQRLGASRATAAFDVNLGCSGYVYGLWQAANLLKSTEAKKALLLVGDTISRIVSEADRSAIALFGDCGTATLLELTDDDHPVVFDLGSDGSGSQNLIVEAGGFRSPTTNETLGAVQGKDGNWRSKNQLFMDGPQVLNFTLREVPKSVKAVVEGAAWSMADVDAFVFHQANKTMLDYLAKRAGVPPERMKFSIQEYGNTSSATIPLTLAATMGDVLSEGSCKLLLSGFGVGWSWGSCAMVAGPMPRPTVREVDFGSHG